MSNEKPQQQPPRPGAPIRIREIRFHSDNPVQGVNLGGLFTQNGATHMLKAQKIGDDEIQIALEPWLRRFRAVYLRNGRPVDEVLIPETWGSYREERNG